MVPHLLQLLQSVLGVMPEEVEFVGIITRDGAEVPVVSVDGLFFRQETVRRDVYGMRLVYMVACSVCGRVFEEVVVSGVWELGKRLCGVRVCKDCSGEGGGAVRVNLRERLEDSKEVWLLYERLAARVDKEEFFRWFTFYSLGEAMDRLLFRYGISPNDVLACIRQIREGKGS